MRREGAIWAVYFLCWFLVALVLASNAARAQGTIQQSGPATTNDALCFVQNGIAKDCGFPPASSIGACKLRTIPSNNSDLATTGDCTIAWASAATSAKTEFLFACSAATKGAVLTIADDVGTAGLYPIKLSPNGTDTVVGASFFVVGFNRQSMTIQCDGAGSWVGI